MIPPIACAPIRFQINKEDGSLKRSQLVDVEAANIDRIFTNSTKLVGGRESHNWASLRFRLAQASCQSFARVT